jgi:hypothetical protein
MLHNDIVDKNKKFLSKILSELDARIRKKPNK